jgi:hypothetical protein
VIIATDAAVAHVVILNVALFVPVVIGGVVASWFGWMLSGRGEEDGSGGSKVDPGWPSPVEPRGGAGPDDLARSA